VIRSEAPRLIADPGPTPRANPVPVTVAIGSPAHFYRSWIPDRAVFGFFVPSAVVVQVRPARDVLGNVSRGCRIVFAQIALLSPTVEVVGGGRCSGDPIFGIIEAVEFRAVAGVYGVGLTIGGNFAFAAYRGNGGGIAVFAYIHAKGACLPDCECHVGSVNLVDIAFAELTDAKIDGAFRDAYLHDVFIEV
jgi:hypothetical protein